MGARVRRVRMRKPLLVNARIIAVMENEWSQMIRNKVIIFTTFAPPFLFVIFALSVLYISTWIDLNYATLARVTRLVADLPASEVTILTHTDQIRVALLSPFLLLFEMVPLVVPLTVASYSIIGEKRSRSLEAVLATPIRTWELLIAKALAAAIPGIAATWYSFAIFVLAARFMVSPVIYH